LALQTDIIDETFRAFITLFFKKKSESGKASQTPQDNKLSGIKSKLTREAWWLSLIFLGFYLTITLATYSSQDPSWSHSVSGTHSIHNAGGIIGSYLSDLLLYIFGLSSWWLSFLCFFSIWLLYPQYNKDLKGYRSFLLFNYFGFFLLISASSAFEAGHLIDLPAQFPLSQGGLLGRLFDQALRSSLGYVGSSIFLITSIAIGFSLFTGWSWLKISEHSGHFTFALFQRGQYRYRDWQDRKHGRIIEQQRLELLESERRKSENRSPVNIESPDVQIKKSERVQKEKQIPLFNFSDNLLPPLHLLDQPSHQVEPQSPETIEFISRLIEKKLMDFGIEAKVISAQPGPVITRYEFEPAPGVKGSQVTNLSKDLARALSVVSVRVVETIPGKTCMGLEIPNPKRQIVYLSEIMSSQIFADTSASLTIALGKDISGRPEVADLSKMPHVLIAGTTGSGKSVAINALILSLLYKANSEKVRMIFIDPKMLELSVYEGIPHLLAPVVTDMRQAANALNWCVGEMERRYKLMSMLGVRNLAGYNQKIKDSMKDGSPIADPVNPENTEPLSEMPLIVIVIDELADLMMVVGKKIEELIARLAQKARASGIHLVLATQRPSVDVITGLIKANIPARIAFQVSSKIDSRTILDQMGAETLLGQGDMLYQPAGSGYPQRIHGAFVSDQEVHKVVSYLKSHGEPNYIEGILTNETSESGDYGDSSSNFSGEKDPLYDEAVELVLRTRKPSISSVQRHLRIGYNRAARIIEDMERAGLVTAMQSNGNRDILAPNQNE
jgi:S-DNA-T family DNA segregation ATPase FtsK/SpoIIIE